MKPWIKDGFLSGVEAFYALLPQAKPSPSALRQCRIVSHRGERDNRVVFENTFAAFDTLISAGVWAIEFDIRWTQDLEPVVVHDLDLLRVFGQKERICDLTLAQLQDTAPQIPSLAELLDRYGGKIHFMIELKAEDYPQPEQQRARLTQLLSSLEPVTDFHFLALELDLFEHLKGFPAACWLPTARANIKQMSDFALRHQCAGMAGPYGLISRRRIQRHLQAGQNLGVGFPAHRNVLYREINRGVRWIFTNQALRLQRMLDADTQHP